jgi:hypothetical protein
MNGIFSDPSFIGSLIEASATLIAIGFAVYVANKQLNLAKEQFRNQLQAAKDELKLSSYENLVIGERQMFGIMMQDGNVMDAILEHFGLEQPLPDTTEKRLLLMAISQISIYESIYYRHEKGVFPRDLWNQWNASMANSFQRDKYFRTIWEKTSYKKYIYQPFREHVDRTFIYNEYEFQDGM